MPKKKARAEQARHYKTPRRDSLGSDFRSTERPFPAFIQFPLQMRINLTNIANEAASEPRL